MGQQSGQFCRALLNLIQLRHGLLGKVNYIHHHFLFPRYLCYFDLMAYLSTP